MTYFHSFKVFAFIALACSITAQGSAVESASSKSDPQSKEASTAYSISVSAGQVQNNQSTANLTISGENSKVSVEKEGTVTLSASKSIHLLPGTKVSAGGFLYASIETIAKNGKNPKKEMRLVTVEEKMKIEAQASLSKAYALFSPFPSPARRHLHSGESENGSYTSENNELSAVTPEQQKKVAVNSRLLPEVTRTQISTSYNPAAEAFACRPETMRVLRL
jgi:hypothetical protein